MNMVWLTRGASTKLQLDRGRGITGSRFDRRISQNQFVPVGTTRISLPATTTIFLGTQVTFAVSTFGAAGVIAARRVR